MSATATGFSTDSLQQSETRDFEVVVIRECQAQFRAPHHPETHGVHQQNG
jgi:hypothetical protein